MSEYLSVAEAAKRMSCSTTQIYRMIAEGLLADHRIGRRHFVASEDVDRFMQFATQCFGSSTASLLYGRMLRESQKSDRDENKKGDM